MHAKLYFESEKLVLKFGEQAVEIPLSIAKLQVQFTPYPPSEMTWEAVIMQVEDLISPYRDALTNYRTLELYHAEPGIVDKIVADLPKTMPSGQNCC